MLTRVCEYIKNIRLCSFKWVDLYLNKAVPENKQKEFIILHGSWFLSLREARLFVPIFWRSRKIQRFCKLCQGGWMTRRKGWGWDLGCRLPQLLPGASGSLSFFRGCGGQLWRQWWPWFPTRELPQSSTETLDNIRDVLGRDPFSGPVTPLLVMGLWTGHLTSLDLHSPIYKVKELTGVSLPAPAFYDSRDSLSSVVA